MLAVEQEWQAAVDDALKRPECKGNWSRARAYVAKTNPDLHKRFVTETNQAAGHAVPRFAE